MVMAADLYRRAFARGAEILGGKRRLANYLEVDLERLDTWSTLTVHPPVQVLQSLAAILKYEILKDYKRPGSGNSKPAIRPKKRGRR